MNRFITQIVRTGHLVGAVRRCAGLTTVYRIAGLGAVAELAVIAMRIVRRMRARTRGLDAHVVGASDAVVANGVVRRVIAGLSGLIAGVGCACDAVVSIERDARLAIMQRVANLDTIAKDVVVTSSIVRRVIAGVRRLIARVGCARHAVVAARRKWIRHATTSRITLLDAVAEDSVAAQCVVRFIHAGMGLFEANVNGARYSIVAAHWRTGHASTVIANFLSIAEDAVLTFCIRGTAANAGDHVVVIEVRADVTVVNENERDASMSQLARLVVNGEFVILSRIGEVVFEKLRADEGRLVFRHDAAQIRIKGVQYAVGSSTL